MAFPLLSTKSRPESVGRAELVKAELPLIQNDHLSNIQSKFNSTIGDNLSRTAENIQNTSESRMNCPLSIHMSEKKNFVSVKKFRPELFLRGIKYPITKIMSLAMKIYEKFQQVSKSQFLMD